MFWFPVQWYLSLGWKLFCRFSLLDMWFRFLSLLEFWNKKNIILSRKNKQFVFITFVYVLKVTSWKLKIPVKYSGLEPYILYTLMFFFWFFLWMESILDFSVFTNGNKIRKKYKLYWLASKVSGVFQPATIYSHCFCKPSSLTEFGCLCILFSPSLFVFPLFNYVFNNVLKKGNMTTTFEHSRIAPVFTY